MLLHVQGGGPQNAGTPRFQVWEAVFSSLLLAKAQPQHGEGEPPQARRPLPRPHDEAAPVPGAPLPPLPQPTQSRRGRRRRGAGGLRPSARPAARRPPPFSASCSLSTSMAPRSPSPPAPPSAAVPGAAAPAPAPPTPAPALANTPPHAGDRGGGSRREPGESERRSETDRARTSPSRYHQPSNMAPSTSARARSPQLSSSRPLRARAHPHTPRSAPGPPSARALRRREGRRCEFGARGCCGALQAVVALSRTVTGVSTSLLCASVSPSVH